jgi:hypothetical protein
MSLSFHVFLNATRHGDVLLAYGENRHAVFWNLHFANGSSTAMLHNAVAAVTPLASVQRPSLEVCVSWQSLYTLHCFKNATLPLGEWMLLSVQVDRSSLKLSVNGTELLAISNASFLMEGSSFIVGSSASAYSPFQEAGTNVPVEDWEYYFSFDNSTYATPDESINFREGGRRISSIIESPTRFGDSFAGPRNTTGVRLDAVFGLSNHSRWPLLVTRRRLTAG